MEYYKDVLRISEIPFLKITEIANAKLEREGKVIYGNELTWTLDLYQTDKRKALLINIEPIEPIEKCTHPLSKLGFIRREEIGNYEESLALRCLCGAIVKPLSFEEVK